MAGSGAAKIRMQTTASKDKPNIHQTRMVVKGPKLKPTERVVSRSRRQPAVPSPPAVPSQPEFPPPPEPGPYTEEVERGRPVPAGRYFMATVGQADPYRLEEEKKLREKLQKFTPTGLSHWKVKHEHPFTMENEPLKQQHPDFVGGFFWSSRGEYEPEESYPMMEQRMDPSLPEDMWSSGLREAMVHDDGLVEEIVQYDEEYDFDPNQMQSPDTPARSPVYLEEPVMVHAPLRSPARSPAPAVCPTVCGTSQRPMSPALGFSPRVVTARAPSPRRMPDSPTAYTPSMRREPQTPGYSPSLARGPPTPQYSPSMARGPLTPGYSPSMARGPPTPCYSPSMARGPPTPGYSPSMARGPPTPCYSPSMARGPPTPGYSPSMARGPLTPGYSPCMARGPLTPGYSPSMARGPPTPGYSPSMTRGALTPGYSPSMARGPMTPSAPCMARRPQTPQTPQTPDTPIRSPVYFEDRAMVHEPPRTPQQYAPSMVQQARSPCISPRRPPSPPRPQRSPQTPPMYPPFTPSPPISTRRTQTPPPSMYRQAQVQTPSPSYSGGFIQRPQSPGATQTYPQPGTPPKPRSPSPGRRVPDIYVQSPTPSPPRLQVPSGAYPPSPVSAKRRDVPVRKKCVSRDGPDEEEEEEEKEREAHRTPGIPVPPCIEDVRSTCSGKPRTPRFPISPTKVPLPVSPISLDPAVTVPDSTVGATLDIIRRLVAEERQDVTASLELPPHLVTKINKMKMKPQSMRVLEETLNHSVPMEEESELLKSDQIAGLLHSQEIGSIDPTSSPRKNFEQLFPPLADEAPVTVSPAAPAPLQDIVVPIGEAAPETVAVINEEIVDVTEEAERDRMDIPAANAFAEAAKSDIEILTTPMPKQSTKGSSPRFEKGEFIPHMNLEEQKPPWAIDLDSLENIVGGKIAIADQPSEEIPSDESIRGIAGRIEYILDVQKPLHYSCVQLRGSQMPAWFPGYFSVLPHVEGYIRLEKSPSRAFQAAWNVLAPHQQSQQCELLVI